MPAGGEDLPTCGMVEVVRRRDVHDLDARVGEQLVEAARRPSAIPSARARAAPRSGVRSEDAADLHAEAAEGLDMDGADEAGADDGRSDLR